MVDLKICEAFSYFTIHKLSSIHTIHPHTHNGPMGMMMVEEEEDTLPSLGEMIAGHGGGGGANEHLSIVRIDEESLSSNG